MSERKEHYMGWLPDYPDFRDFNMDKDNVPKRLVTLDQKDSIKGMLRKLGVSEAKKIKLSDPQDLREYCSPIEDQGNLGSCTACAGAGLLEYYERRASGKHIDASRLFLYKVTRNLLQLTGDTGAFLRTTMGAMVLFGIPPEKYWTYVVENFDEEPPAFCYSFGQNYQAIQYFRLDPPGTQKDELLKRIMKFIATGLPSMFGFSVYSSYEQAAANGKIPFPCPGESRIGGHAVVAVGYNDKIETRNRICGKKTKGALLIRNSWGTSWGDSGYGWLPYDYVLRGLAVDWWTILKNEWVNTGVFNI
jgi:C1A family cysteine protease